VYVANHQSYLDIYSLFHIRRPFKASACLDLALICSISVCPSALVHLQDEQLSDPHHRLEYVPHRPRAAEAHGPAQPDGVPAEVQRAAAPQRARPLLPGGAHTPPRPQSALSRGAQGTRSSNGRMAEFKKGAFTIAAKEGVPVVPITLRGTGALMRNGREHSLFPGTVVITVHPQIAPADADEMCADAQKAIQSALPEAYHWQPAA